MQLTIKQEEGLKTAVTRYKNKEPYTCISGYAGTGKSTLVKFIIAALNLSDDEVTYVAFTGKAAKVLQQKGCPNAMTAHKLLYYSKQKPNGRYEFRPRPKLENADLKVIVVDEVSMLPKDMWELLLTHKVYVLALGDPFQIPPIDKEQDNHILDKPHIFLDEIMRQALDSEIIRCSMWIREGKSLASYPAENKEVMIFSKNQKTDDMLLWADQIICSTNKERHSLNKRMRELKGFGPDPQVGDKIINLSNHWDFESSNTTDPVPLTNGSIGTVTSLQPSCIYIPSYIYEKQEVPILYTSMVDEDGEIYEGMPADQNVFYTGEKTLTGRQEFLLRKGRDLPLPPFDITYGYAITGHKSQGSQWDKVLIQEEWFPNETVEHARWLYTTITRAAKKCVIIRK